MPHPGLASPSRIPDTVGKLLVKLCAGEEQAFNELMPLVYGELRQRASRALAHEGVRHAFDPADLVHETYLRLVKQRDKCWENRAHFLAVSATAMRRVLLDYVRRHRRLKRGPDLLLSIDPDLLPADVPPHLATVDDAVTRLGTSHPRAGRVLELRFFGGLTLAEIAAVLRLSVATVKRDWAMARAWLREELVVS